MVAFCDIIEERAQKAAKEYGDENAKVYTDYRELLEDKTIDAVHVCTPNNGHAPIFIAAMETDKHVLCEKPIARNVAEAEAMLGAAKRTGKILTFVHGPIPWEITHGHLKDLGIKFDPSQTSYTGMDYMKQTKDWGKRFQHVHIKGSIILDGERYDHPPAGMDETDWPSFISALYKGGYTGGLSLGPHSQTWGGDMWDKGVDFTIKYINRLIFRD